MFILGIMFCFFFFKQKTAYEMRISDWSSDVCSSDLCAPLNYDFHVAEAKSDSGINFGTAITDSKSIGAFLKASSALVGPSQGVAIRFPDRRHDHEIELVAVIGAIADRVAPTEALAHVAGYSVGLDMTMRGTEDRSLRKSTIG